MDEKKMNGKNRMKKSLAVLILAGMLTAGLASCVVRGDKETPTGTEPPYTGPVVPDHTVPIPQKDPSQVIYAPVDEILYVSANSASLKLVSDTSKVIALGITTELHCIGKGDGWCKVEYQGAQYFVAESFLTSDDLGEKTFTKCNKTMYVNTGSVKVRPYASTNDNFSKEIGFRKLNEQVKVIAESKEWAKIEWTNDKGKTENGFIFKKFLSDKETSGEDDSYLKNFTALDKPAVMYVTADQLFLRSKPFADGRGTLVTEKGLEKGTAVTVIARGTVEDVNWSMISWEKNGVPIKAFVSSAYLDVIPSGGVATLDQYLAAYPELKPFETALDLYICTDNAFGRSTPTRVLIDGKNANVIKTLVKTDKVKAVATGKIEGQDPDGKKEEITWCLIEDSTLGYYFIAYSNLTPNSDGSPAQIPVSLDQLIATYGFEKVTSKVKTTKVIKGMSAPDADSVILDIPVGTVLDVVAQGKTGDEFVTVKWYIVQYQNTYYFIVNDPANLDLA